MASGAVHYQNNKRIATVELVICGYFALTTLKVDPVITCIIGNLLGILATPDLDLPSASYTEWLIQHWTEQFGNVFGVSRNVSRGLGRTAKKLVMAATGPYAFLIPHRHWLSHAPIIGTVGRALYFYSVYWTISAVYFGLHYSFGTPIDYPTLSLLEIWGMFNFKMILLFWESHNLMHLCDDGFMIQVGGMGGKKGTKIYLLGKPLYNFIHKRTAAAEERINKKKKERRQRN